MGEARFNFGKRENPYGSLFTERQRKIIWGLPVENLKVRELTTIIRKAEKLGLTSRLENVYAKHDEMTSDKTPPKYTKDEAEAVLRELTPWED